jgi:bifunctional DNA-binding transcriptional regulator/antitoxin component of YhaV-PrlF toxin-antitoxin module
MKRKYQVVISKRIGEELGTEAGQKLEIILYENRIEFIPVRSPQEIRGFLMGIETTVQRESARP